ncbi:MAG: ComF family protein [Polyangiaceae bacterium]|jgi:ComF family protein
MTATDRRGAMVAMSAFALDAFFAVLAPPRCAACLGPLRRLQIFCLGCASTTRAAPRNRFGAIAAFAYGGAIARALVRLKYERRPDLARPLGELLWRSVMTHRDALDAWVVVPVPLHPRRLAERGFNQSALLARPIACGLRAPLWGQALTRRTDTQPQTKLDREARARNVADAFVTDTPDRFRGRRVLLIDDVRTTGATLEACTRVLRYAGAANVGWAVLAQAAERTAVTSPPSEDASIHEGKEQARRSQRGPRTA